MFFHFVFIFEFTKEREFGGVDHFLSPEFNIFVFHFLYDGFCIVVD